MDEENAGNTANNGMNPMEIMMMSQMGGGMGGMGGVGMTDPSMKMPAASVANDLTSGGKDHILISYIVYSFHEPFPFVDLFSLFII